ncbi:hypothetical protein MX629_08210 [Carnobacterium divergens]|uniref:NERD domain-containing protein n=1 Tax=Carnobacterium divergens TaxID=2748 RepID=A0AAW8R996_CARDV|nr:hypothetical protein [Carnobacterium divergens]MDT1958401.1 hypothetical protein [Carnobacterium divergens]MDT1974250.1 hypothetical protein [Carnobacterium divergens]
MTDVVESIQMANSIEVLLEISKRYYSKIPISQRSLVFNQVIFQRKLEPEDDQLSLKLAMNLSFLFMTYPVKMSIRERLFKKINVESEFGVFRLFIQKMYQLYLEQQIEQSEGDLFTTYLNYHFHFPSIAVGDYLELFKLFDKISKKIYGFSIYNLAGVLLFFTSNTNIDEEGKMTITNAWISNKDMKNYFDRELYPIIISGLFADVSEVNSEKLLYPTAVPKLFKGKIGLRFKTGYFVPQCEFIFENILRYLIEASESDKFKGNVLEDHTRDILKNFFTEGTVTKTYYDEEKNEQDILVQYKDYLLVIECKAHDFKEVYRDQDAAVNRLNQRFNHVILKGCKQCERVKERVTNNESVVFYDSDKANKRKKIIELPNTANLKILKVVVTLDDYLNLSESPHEFLDEKYQDTWIVNLFTLKRILWASNQEKLIKYIEYRTSALTTISSINSDELDQYGYYVSPNYDIFPPNNIGISIHLMSGFSKMFDHYDDESFKKQWKLLSEHLNR